jgi:hypothetical protein
VQFKQCLIFELNAMLARKTSIFDSDRIEDFLKVFNLGLLAAEEELISG